MSNDILIKSKINIAVVTTVPFPSGNASINRIISYSKGLIEMGNEVTVLSTSNCINKDYSYYEGIRYRCLGKITSKNKKSVFILLHSLLKLLKILIDNKDKYQALILVSNSLLLIYPLFVTCKIKNIKYIQEKSEFPFVLNAKSFLKKLYAKFYISTTYKLFDGMIIMTHALGEYFRKLTNPKCKKIIMPMTVNPERFEGVYNNEIGEYIAYCGDIGGNKDGVENLIASFESVQKKYPELKLLLIGDSKDKNERIKLESYVLDNEIKNVIFQGYVERDEIPGFLCNAKILALARPDSLQSTGGFPTKLGEYLSTGNPVVVTKVGDIPLYLKDNDNAFLVEPDNIEAFTNKIIFVIENYQQALSVAQMGRDLVYNVFNYKYQSSRLNEFLEDILINNKQ